MKERSTLDAIKQGNEIALEDLMHNYYPQIYSYVYHRMKGNDCAADITQEVFIRFISKISTFEYQGKTKNYLLKMANNQCKEWYRRQKELQMDDIYLSQQAIESKNPKFDHDQLSYLLSKLPDELQEVLLLKYFHQLKSKEIATLLEIPDSTVKTRVRTGLKKLKELTRKEDWL